MVAASSLFAALAVTGSTMAAAVLPRIEEELPCMQPSLNFQKWTVSDFTYGWITTATSPSHTYTNTEVKFKVSSDALSNPIECSGKNTIPNFRGDQVFNCQGTIISNMQFSYDSDTLVLKLGSGWLCDTKQFQHAGSVKIPLGCTAEYKKTPDWTPESQLPFSTDRMDCASPEAFDVPSDTPGAGPLVFPETTSVAPSYPTSTVDPSTAV
ncbi:hypothetical protein Cpir12675_002704 [Ceratocystis pirilliformis]|uniref:AA1-like domain-containing protein n=1 Tax=Ceratocystis pirilliformis TaxID=259994 RepID=A0ABR3Z942_9PEZI